MYCVEAPQIFEEIIKKSRFIGVLSPCNSEAEAHSQLRQLHTDHASATHIAFAYRIKTPDGLIYRFHDAGEPTGTAGKPIYQHLEGKNLVNALVAVIRYYGGIKLGAGGLTRAYGNTAKHVIETATLIPNIDWLTVPLNLDYKDLQALEYLLKKINGHIIQQDFTEQVKLLVQLPAEQLAVLTAAFPSHY